MKIKHTIRSGIYILFFVILFFFSSKVLAYNLKFQAEIINNFDSGDQRWRLRWTNYVKAFEKNDPNYNYEENREYEKHSVLSNNGGNASYKTKGVTFQKEPTTKYTGNQVTGALPWSFGYDENDSAFKFNIYRGDGSDKVYDLATYRSKVTLYTTYLSSKGDWGNNVILTVNPENNRSFGWDVYQVKGSTRNYFTINTFELNGIAGKELEKRMSEDSFFKEDEQGNYRVYFSGNLHTYRYGDRIYYTAYDFMNAIRSPGDWASENYGYNGTGLSAINNFDNIMLVPAARRNIFVAHRIGGSDEHIVKDVVNVWAYDGNKAENVFEGGTSNVYEGYDIKDADGGWQEKYTTKEKLRVLSASSGSKQITYNGKKYKVTGIQIFSLNGNTDWNNPLWRRDISDSDNGPIYCDIDDANQTNYTDIGVMFFYDEVNEDDGVEVYVNYIDQSTNTKITEFKKTLSESELGKFTPTTKDVRGYPQKFTMGISESGGIYIRDAVFKNTETLTYNGNNYKYVGIKYAYGSDYDEAIRNGDSKSYNKPDNKYRGISISNPGQKRVYLVSFYFNRSNKDEGDTPKGNEYEPPNISGRLDFINNLSQFIGSTYSRNNNDRTGASALDYIPAGEQLSPYIYGVQPYFIKAIDYSKGNSTSGELSSTLTGTWEESTGHKETCPPDCESDHITSKSISYTYKATVNHTFYKIDNLVMYRISNIKATDSNSNIGGKLFQGSDTVNINLSSSYNDRSTAKVTQNTLNAKFNVTSGSYAFDSEPSASEVASEAGLKVEYTASNAYITLDNSESLVVKNEKVLSYDIRKQKDNTINIDTTSEIDYLNNIDDYMKGTRNLTTKDDFNYDKYTLRTVNTSNQNGIRQLKGTITYSKVNVVGGTGDFTADKMLKNNNNANIIEKNMKLTGSKISTNFQGQYENENNNSDKVRRVNVLTPLHISASISTENSVNHSNVNNSILQTGKEFTLNINPNSYVGTGYINVDTSKYVQGYYITFDFRFKYTGGDKAKVYNYNSGVWNDLKIGDEVDATTDIYISKSSSATLRGISIDTKSAESAWSASNNISVVAVTKSINNTTLRKVFDSDRKNLNASLFNNFSNWLERYSSWGNFFEFNKYIDSSSSTIANTNKTELTAQVKDKLLNRTDLYASANHAVRTSVVTNNVGRIFNFMVTDCNDLGYKNVFRKQNESSTVNQHSNIVYFSGKKYFAYSQITSLSNEFMLEDKDRKTLIPLGPYKNTNSTYIFAPKLGYRISFSLKTSGYYKRRGSTKKIEIEPQYYYISKDGQRYIKNIKLYYKDTSGKYKNFVNSGYKISFIPNDGYRYGLNDTNIDRDDLQNVSTKQKYLNVSGTMTLDTDMMLSESSGYIQNWFGEYKLPNSTIAINMDNATNGFGHTSVNDPLTDGYIGVIFKIKSIETRGSGVTIETLYDQNDKTKGSLPNTSEWDYEGYMGVTAGKPINNIGIQLQKGVWTINDNKRYNEIKGTVILYDIDERAANDFN